MAEHPNADILPSVVSVDDVRAASIRLQGVTHQTPVMHSSAIDAVLSKHGNGLINAFFKCEQFQRVGAFKFRGAFNALSLLTEDESARGVITFSSGNHAQAVALAGRILGIQTTIVMPENAPRIKYAATCEYLDESNGSEIVLYDPNEITREKLGNQIATERGLTLIRPYDHPNVIAGQGTAALEFVAQLKDDFANPSLDYIFVPCGGGGLLSGTSIVIREYFPNCIIVGVEPEAGNDAFLSFRDRKLHTVHNPQTIADGARTPALGRWTFPIVCKNVDVMMTVSDDALRAAMQLVMERMKVLVEPTAVLGLAGLFRAALEPETLISGENFVFKVGSRGFDFTAKTTTTAGIIFSGGNVDLSQISSLLHGAE